MGTLVIDIGNTRLAWRYRGSSGDLRFGTASHHAITDVFDELPQARKIAISSVRRDHEGEIQNWLDSTSRSDVTWIRSGADLTSNVLTEEPDKTGADRALCALAWGARSEGRGAVIIDAGSAVTVDAVTAAGELLGGWIAPGLYSLRVGLQQVTPSLPDPTGATDDGHWSRESRSAVHGGLHTLFVAGVKALRERVLKGLEADTMTVVTGGDAQPLVDSIEGAIHQPGLVLDGLETILNRDREHE